MYKRYLACAVLIIMYLIYICTSIASHFDTACNDHSIITNNVIKSDGLDAEWSDLTYQLQAAYAEQLLYRCCFNPFISKYLSKYYNDTRQYWNFEITHIKAGDSGYIVTVQVETFTGAHNPPYGIETFAFEISYTQPLKFIEFQHKDE